MGTRDLVRGTRVVMLRQPDQKNLWTQHTGISNTHHVVPCEQKSSQEEMRRNQTEHQDSGSLHRAASSTRQGCKRGNIRIHNGDGRIMGRC
jgi:hypothetical protein